MRTRLVLGLLFLIPLVGCDDPFGVEPEPIAWEHLAVGSDVCA